VVLVSLPPAEYRHLFDRKSFASGETQFAGRTLRAPLGTGKWVKSRSQRTPTTWLNAK
jgi:hypothetical protein